mmetsp:Transcript_108935/g.308145  ORF Transcript_108935/g.308145 Transcript_108935/m.308145 type:complete len:208 (-) Transcript_108935:683-1306(-)
MCGTGCRLCPAGGAVSHQQVPGLAVAGRVHVLPLRGRRPVLRRHRRRRPLPGGLRGPQRGGVPGHAQGLRRDAARPLRRGLARGPRGLLPPRRAPRLLLLQHPPRRRRGRRGPDALLQAPAHRGVRGRGRRRRPLRLRHGPPGRAGVPRDPPALRRGAAPALPGAQRHRPRGLLQAQRRARLLLLQRAPQRLGSSRKDAVLQARVCS